jgi:hypothetical protein
MGNKQTYNISTSENRGVLEIVITGIVTRNCYENVENEFDAIIKSTKAKKLLLDIRDVKGRVGYIEAYSRVRKYSPYIHIKTAIIDIQENAEFQKFQERTAVNAGLSLKWFTDADAARIWLKSRSKKLPSPISINNNAKHFLLETGFLEICSRINRSLKSFIS